MLQQLNASFSNLSEQFMTWLDQVILHLPNILIALILMAVAIFASRTTRKYLQRLMNKLNVDRSVSNLVAGIGAALIVGFGLFCALMVLNLDKALTSLLAGAGVVGLAIGLALQDPLVNTFSGVMMSIRKFYNIGDWVKTNNYEGKIKSINLRWTELRKPSGELIILPNKMIVSNPLENLSIAGRRRVDVKCGISYEEDLEAVEKLTKKTIFSKFDNIKNIEDVEFFYTDFGDSSINFEVRFWINTTSILEYKMAASNAIKAIKKAFDNREITIPFPIRTLDFNLSKGIPLNSNESKHASNKPKPAPMIKNNKATYEFSHQ